MNKPPRQAMRCFLGSGRDVYEDFPRDSPAAGNLVRPGVRSPGSKDVGPKSTAQYEHPIVLQLIKTL
jgi:hypothetical protein